MRKCELKRNEKLIVEIWVDKAEMASNWDYDNEPSNLAGCYPVKSAERFILAAASGIATGVEYYRDADVKQHYLVFSFKNKKKKGIFLKLIKDHVIK